ncbi:protein still isoform sif type 1 isoform x1 [Lasius niger]|uniref:Protein still isoform sif type 1 isoform x1 n=1 Tax=Lasius niger TaxID=67767 RepID=A0A0J7KMU9_LASNI|nr:protein still isoform sif type 1 isoform x1 [Lasius niger]
MGNKLSCSCAPLIRSKTYRYEDSPWQAGARGGMGGGGRRGDTGHLLRCGSLRERKRLWAEVFHVNSSGAGTVKWQQVSEDLVPVNITCIQDSPECVFHITAYNSQVDKILDVRLVQPVTVVQDFKESVLFLLVEARATEQAEDQNTPKATVDAGLTEPIQRTSVYLYDAGTVCQAT